MGSISASAVRDPSLTRHLDELFPTLEQLVDAADRAKALLASPTWDTLAVLLNAEVATIDRELDGAWREPLSQAEFAGRHGRRDALTAPDRFLRLLIDRAETRLAEQRRKHEQHEASGETLAGRA